MFLSVDTQSTEETYMNTCIHTSVWFYSALYVKSEVALMAEFIVISY